MSQMEVTDAERDVILERRRQVSAEGYTSEHDDAHAGGELARAAAAYAWAASDSSGYAVQLRHDAGTLTPMVDLLWPWEVERVWKPKDKRRDLIRAGALILAEIERLDRKP